MKDNSNTDASDVFTKDLNEKVATTVKAVSNLPNELSSRVFPLSMVHEVTVNALGIIVAQSVAGREAGK